MKNKPENTYTISEACEILSDATNMDITPPVIHAGIRSGAITVEKWFANPLSQKFLYVLSHKEILRIQTRLLESK